MRALVVCLWLLAGCAATSRSPRTRDGLNCAWRVCIQMVNTPAGRAYRAENGEPVPATVTLTFVSPGNLRTGADRPIERVIPPRSSRILVRLRTVLRDTSVQPDVSVSIDLGSSTTEADDDHLYAVPFGGDSRRELVQGFDGDVSHVESMRYSLDFAMPEGTPILAARAGTVLYLQDGFTEGGTDPDLLEAANLVVVAHSDGTMASYGHLTEGISVAVGDTVLVGDLLGVSGSTGFTGGPHLHFHVGKRMLGEPGRTIPIKIRDRNGRLLDLAKGLLVEPARANSR
ncbi:MAG TPA: M23 family metallopeptidase [Gemmatimonadetes bacterium]|nr:M23 family metallopeptidase [Gemmatimonadota bacterium]